MTLDLVSALGLGPRELVAFTGGGGKSTLLLGLSRQLERSGARVVVSTTTKLGLDQTEGRAVCWSADPEAIDAALQDHQSVLVLQDADDNKVVGFGPEAVDDWFANTVADYVLVEADGARRRPLKAPAGHEPVVPSTATVVVAVVGIDAIGQPLGAAVHRPEQGVALTGLGLDDPITTEAVATILTHPEGGRRGVPASARLIVAITKVGPATEAVASQLAAYLSDFESIWSVVTVPFEEHSSSSD